MAATPVNDLVCDMICTIESARMGLRFSISLNPAASSATTLPRYATRETAPEMEPSSTKACMRAGISFKRSISMEPAPATVGRKLSTAQAKLTRRHSESIDRSIVSILLATYLGDADTIHESISDGAPVGVAARFVGGR